MNNLNRLLPYLSFFLFFSIIGCYESNKEEKHKIRFEYVAGISNMNIYNMIEFDSSLYLFTKNHGVVSISTNKDSISIQKYSDLGKNWTYFHDHNDSLFLGYNHDKYFLAKIKSNLFWIDSTKIYSPEYFINSNNYPAFYEDDYFIMSDCCMGEFGGTLFIKDNKSDLFEYAIESTCPYQIVNRKNGKYYLINDLRHLSGISSIIQIDSVKNIIKLKDNQDNECNYFSTFYSENMDEFDPFVYDSLQQKILGDGNKYIFDSIRIQILNGYLLPNDKLGIQYLSEGKLKYGEIEDGKIKDANTIYEIEDSDWTYGRFIKLKNSKGIFTRDIKWDTIQKKEITISNSVFIINNENPNSIKAFTFDRKHK